MLTLTLPYPISSNRYWRPVRIGNHITIVPTKEAKAYRANVASIAAGAGAARIAGRVAMVIELYPNRPQDFKKRMRDHGDAWDDTVMCIDLGNCEKVLSDALQNVVFGDDKLLHDIHLKRMEPDGEARVVVHLTPYVRTVYAVQQALELPAPVVPRIRIPEGEAF